MRFVMMSEKDKIEAVSLFVWLKRVQFKFISITQPVVRMVVVFVMRVLVMFVLMVMVIPVRVLKCRTSYQTEFHFSFRFF